MLRVFRTKLGTEKLFTNHEFCWWLLGQKPKKQNRTFYFLYSFLFNVIFPICWPLHLSMQLFFIDTADDLFRNLAINVTTTLCTVKSYIIWWNLKRIREIEDIMSQLDERVLEPEDIHYYKEKTLKSAKNIVYLFYFLCFGSGISIPLVIITMGLMGNWRLLYPAFYPYDSYESTLKLVCTHCYQIVGVILHIVQNFINDTYGGMCMSIIVGHARLLGRRVARIGYDRKKTPQANNEELFACIKDHKLLLKFREKLVEVVSFCLFFQIGFASLIMCTVIIYVMFFETNAFYLVYYTMYFLAMPMEIFPCCYYGSKMEFEFENLTRTIFECNWMEQNKNFKKNFCIFTERTLRPVMIEAGRMVRVNLTTFLTTCKMSYSLFTVLSQMK